MQGSRICFSGAIRLLTGNKFGSIVGAVRRSSGDDIAGRDRTRQRPPRTRVAIIAGHRAHLSEVKLTLPVIRKGGVATNGIGKELEQRSRTFLVHA